MRDVQLLTGGAGGMVPAPLGEAGLAALVEAADRTPTSKDRSLALEVLTTLAADKATTAKLPFVPAVLVARLRELFARPPELSEIAGQILRRYVLPMDEDMLSSVGTQLHKHVLPTGPGSPSR